MASCVWLLIGGPAGIDTIATIAEVPSPDRAWMVRVDELEDEGYLGAGVIVTNVHLAPTGGKAKGADILVVDSDGHDANQPRIAWTATNVLQVTIRNLSYVTVYRREFAGIRYRCPLRPSRPRNAGSLAQMAKSAQAAGDQRSYCRGAVARRIERYNCWLNQANLVSTPPPTSSRKGDYTAVDGLGETRGKSFSLPGGRVNYRVAAQASR